jgi:hypothetical protein
MNLLQQVGKSGASWQADKKKRDHPSSEQSRFLKC